MNWNQAKNLTIIFLLILNACLAFLVYAADKEYVMTLEQETAIFNVLSKNKISLYQQMPKNYEPRRPIIMSPSLYDSQEMLKVFLSAEPSVAQTIEYNRTIYSAYGKSLILYPNHVEFLNSNSNQSPQFESGAKAYCDEFIAQFPSVFPDYEFDNSILVDDAFILFYRQNYKRNIIYTNYAAFHIKNNSIVKIEYVYNEPVSFEREKREICSADEALMIFLQNTKNLRPDSNRPFMINQIDMVYYQEDISEEKNTFVQSIPCYRLYLDGYEYPFLINAYTGEMENLT